MTVKTNLPNQNKSGKKCTIAAARHNQNCTVNFPVLSKQIGTYVVGHISFMVILLLGKVGTCNRRSKDKPQVIRLSRRRCHPHSNSKLRACLVKTLTCKIMFLAQTTEAITRDDTYGAISRRHSELLSVSCTRTQRADHEQKFSALSLEGVELRN